MNEYWLGDDGVGQFVEQGVDRGAPAGVDVVVVSAVRWRRRDPVAGREPRPVQIVQQRVELLQILFAAGGVANFTVHFLLIRVDHLSPNQNYSY